MSHSTVNQDDFLTPYGRLCHELALTWATMCDYDRTRPGVFLRQRNVTRAVSGVLGLSDAQHPTHGCLGAFSLFLLARGLYARARGEGDSQESSSRIFSLMATVIMGLSVIVPFASSYGQQVQLDSVASWNSIESDSTQTLAWGDVDGDGDLDLAVGNANQPNRVYYNRNGTLELVASWSSVRSDYTRDLAWGDVDGDGNLDLAEGNWNQPNRVYLNRNGTLEVIASWNSSDSDKTLSLAWGDVDGDGDLDLATGNGGQPNRVYHNQNGILEVFASWSSEESDVTQGLAWGDVDGDGDLDLAAGNDFKPNRVYYNRNGTLETVASWGSAELDRTGSLAWGDVNGDGKLDLAAGNWSGPNKVYYNRNDTLEDVASWSSAESVTTVNIAWGDVNGDGYLDLASGGWPIRIHYNRSGVLDSVAGWRSANPGGGSIAWGDVDGDGDLDLAAGDRYRSNRVYINRSGTIEAVASWSFGGSDRTRILAWGDVDGDGDLDVAVGNDRSPTRLYYNRNGTLEDVASWSSAESADTRSLAWGDVDGDGDLDLAVGSNHLPIRIYYNRNGTLEIVASWSSTGPLLIASLAWGDVNGDGDLDLAVGDPSGMNTIYYNRNGTLEDNPFGFFLEFNDTRGLAWGDVDGDGDLDLAEGNWNQPNRVYYNRNGTLELLASWRSAELDGTKSIAWGDVDGDGDLDLAAGNSSQPNRVYYNHNGALETVASWSASESDGTNSIAWGDVDGDGDLDLAAGNGIPPNKVYYNLNGTLETVASWSSRDSAATFSLAWGDVDGDGDLDLAAGNSETYPGGHANTVYINRNGSLDCDAARLPNASSCISDLATIPSATLTNVTFALTDAESDPVSLVVDYSSLGGGLWLPATILGNTLRLESSPSGTSHQINWNTDADGVDGYDVWLRLRASSNPDHAGLILRPASSYLFQIGRFDNRPKISLIYPPRLPDTARVLRSLVVLGKIWDATNFSDYRVLLGPNDSSLVEQYTSSDPLLLPDHIVTIALDTLAAGNYTLRTAAHDSRDNETIVDRTITIAESHGQSPRIISAFPHVGETSIPANAPVVVRFDSDMNQAAITTQTINLISETGTLYKDAAYDYSTRTLTLNPPTRYDISQFHYAVVSSEFQNQQGNELNGEFVLGFTTSNESPSASIIAISPLRGEVGVGLGSPVIVSFNGPSQHQFVAMTDLAGNAVDVESSTFDSSDNRLTVYPSLLAPRTYYLIRISDVPTFDGAADYMSYFITADTDLPMISRIEPVDRDWLVGLTDAVRVIFSKAINTFTVDSTSFYVVGPNPQTVRVLGVIEFGGEGANTATFFPQLPYEPESEYTVYLTSHIQDNLGKPIVDSMANPFDTMSWTFTTGVFNTVGFDGGTIFTGDFGLYFPQGSLSQDTTVGLGVVPAGVTILGPSVDAATMTIDMEPSAKLFRDAVLSVDVPDSMVSLYGGAEALSFSYCDLSETNCTWQYIGGTASGNTISVSINKLGRYGLFKGAPTTTPAVDFASSVELIPRVINPRRGSPTGNAQLNVAYKISQPTHVMAKIYSQRGRLVKTLMSGSTSSVGDQLLQWDGRTDDGSYANDGIYILMIEAEGKQVQKTFVVLSK